MSSATRIVIWLGVTLLLLCVASTWYFSSSILMPGSRHRQESRLVLKQLKDRLPSILSLESQESVALYQCAQVHSSEITVYGICDSKEQDAICEILGVLRQTIATRPIKVRFFEAEVLHHAASADGKVRHMWRGEEKLLRTTTIR